MSGEARRLRVVRPAPAPRLLEHGEGGQQSPVPLRTNGGADLPFGLLRVGPADLDEGIAAVRAGALPGALITGIGELPDLTSRARRVTRDLELPWLVDPLLFKTALPGYRTARHLQTLDYTPGRDADPYEPRDFADQDLLRRIARPKRASA